MDSDLGPQLPDIKRNLPTKPTDDGALVRTEADCRSVFQQLVAKAKDRIRLGDEACANMVKEGTAALYHYMAAGDALLEALERDKPRVKKVWLKENGFVITTAFVYMRLARHRTQIEAEKSVRSALKLICTSKKSDKEPDEGLDEESESDKEPSSSNKPEAEAGDRGQALQDRDRHGVNGNGHGSALSAAQRDDDHNGANDALRELVLQEYFAQATGSDIVDRIAKARGAVTHTEYLDKLEVAGVLECASKEFKQQLCQRLPGKSKKFKTMTAVMTGRSASGQPIFTPQGRGGHSRSN